MIKTLALAILAAAATGIAEPSSELNREPRAPPSSISHTDVVRLPEFVVQATRIGGHPWRYISIPGFEIISCCKDSETTKYVRSLIFGNEVRETWLPDGCLAPLSTPNTVILYHDKPAADPAESVIPSPAENSLYDNDDPEGLRILLSDPGEVDDKDATADCVNLWDADIRKWWLDDSTDIIWSQAFGFRLRNRVPRFPAWFFQGPLELSHDRWRHRWGFFITEPRIPGLVPSTKATPSYNWISQSETESLRKKSASPPPFLPLEQIFASKNLANSTADPIWRAEAGLFVRWGLYGQADPDPRHPSAFWTFVNRATEEPVTEKMFRECFGFGFAEMEQRLKGYFPRAIREDVELPLTTNRDPRVPQLRDATDVETARIVGDWERIEGESLNPGNPKLARRYFDEAGRTLFKPYAKGSRDPFLLAALGLYEHAVGADDKALGFLETAAEAKVKRPSVYLALAQLRFSESAAHPAGHNGKFSSEQVTSVLGPLLVARSQTPAMVEVYRLMAETWSQSAAKPTPEDLAALDKGLRFFWSDPTLANAVVKLR